MNEKEKQDNKGEYKEFRELLKKGIGLRTQADFAESCGITRPYLNTLLKKDFISRPTAETLGKMAKAMKNVSYKELMESCGYPSLDIQELADEVASEAVLFFSINDKNGMGPVSHGPLLELCDIFYMLYCPAGIKEMKFNVKEEKDNTNAKYPDADKETLLEIKWNNEEYDCVTRVELFYALTKSGGRVMLGVEIKKTKAGDSAIIEKKSAKKKAADLLMAKLFGNEDDPLYPTYYVGLGFPYKETPKKFKEFLSNHRKTFCTDERKSELWRQIVVNGEDPDEACKNFSDKYENDNTLESEKTTTGTIIADIMNSELSKIPWIKDIFELFEEDENLPEGDRDSFIMTIKNIYGPEERKAIKPYIYFYAHELGISHFGTCYYRYMEKINRSDWNDTEEYGKMLE